MRIWGLSDTHLSFSNPKPMDIFGEHWRDHPARIAHSCNAVIEPEDLLLMPGDLSWAMKRTEANSDLAWLASLPGHKVLCKGNHDYWWDSDRPLAYPGLFDTPFRSRGDRVGVAGTRGWIPVAAATTDEERAQYTKIVTREVGRLTKRLATIVDCELKIALSHYPPLQEFADPMLQAGVSIVLYGHLHLNSSDIVPPEDWNGMRIICVACDRINFVPRLIATLSR